MAVLRLRITSPADGDVVVGRTPVRFSGTVGQADPTGRPLHARWWSTLPADPGPPAGPGEPPDLDRVAISPRGGALSFSRSLWLGSQAITFTAKDVAGDDAAALADVRQAGVAGGATGSAATGPACVVHVLVAQPLVATDGTVSRGQGAWAEAPTLWPEQAYASLDRLDYEWSFTPSGGGPTVVLRTSRTGQDGRHRLRFQPREPEPAGRPPRVGVSPLPAAVPAGQSTMTLTVRHRAPGAGPVGAADAVTRTVVVVP